MKNIIDFLNTLQQNNNKVWFDASKSWYLEVQNEFHNFVEKLIAGIGSFDSSISHLQPKECTYRIYRDVRFSHNKDPYKTHFGAYICQGGKQSDYAGYYFHLEADRANFLGNSMLAAGIYSPAPKVLYNLRKEIQYNSNTFFEVIRAQGFSLDDRSKLKRIPTGFPSDQLWSEYLKYKDYTLYKPISKEELFSDNLLERVVVDFKKTKPMLDFFNGIVLETKEDI